MLYFVVFTRANASMQLYCLVQAAKLKIILKEEDKQLRAIEVEHRIQTLVQEMVLQQSHQLQQFQGMKASTPLPRRALNRSTSRMYGSRSKNYKPGDDVAVDMPEGSSAM